MKIFIAGATGVLGKRVVKTLTAKRHEVTALSRSRANADWLEKNRACPRSANLFDEPSLRKAVSGSEAVLHLATAIPGKTRTSVNDWALNDRIRRQGTQNLIMAALHNGCQRFVQQSVTFIYGDRNGAWVDESSDLPVRHARILQSAVDMERIVQKTATASSLPSVILRFAAFYGHDSAHTQSLFQMAQKGRLASIGAGDACWNLIHLDDAASAVVSVVENEQENLVEIFNVCDDRPASAAEILEFVAKSFGAERLRRVPAFLAKLVLGAHAVETLTASARCKNSKLKDKTGWTPEFSSFREGYKAEIEKWLALSHNSEKVAIEA